MIENVGTVSRLACFALVSQPPRNPPLKKQEHASVLIILRVIMVGVFFFVPLVLVVLVGLGGLTCVFGGDLQAQVFFFIHGPRGPNSVRVLISTKIIRSCMGVLIVIACSGLRGGGLSHPHKVTELSRVP